MVNPMYSLPGYGAILDKCCNKDTSSEERTIGDLLGSVLDYLVRQAWSYLGFWPEEEERHREGCSIIEIQEFLDWAMRHWIEDMELNPEELDQVYDTAVKEFMNRPDEEEES